MNYEQFKSAVITRIEQLLGPEISVQLHTIHKNNGIKLDGLVITDKASNLSPTIFLDYYYEKQAVSFDIEAICRDILLTYEKKRAKEPVNIDFFTDYTILRSHICYRVINYEKNKELLETVPYVRYLEYFRNRQRHHFDPYKPSEIVEHYRRTVIRAGMPHDAESAAL